MLSVLYVHSLHMLCMTGMILTVASLALCGLSSLEYFQPFEHFEVTSVGGHVQQVFSVGKDIIFLFSYSSRHLVCWPHNDDESTTN